MSVPDLKIKKAGSDEAQELSDLAFRSKAYWDYSDEFMQACKAELTYTAQQIQNNHCYVAMRDNAAVGFYIMKRKSDVILELDALFIEPAQIGKGIGRTLIKHAVSEAGELGAEKIHIQGDPHAVKFYLTVGAIQTGESESQSIEGRYLPTFEIRI